MKTEVFAPIIGSLSGLTGLFTGQGPVQWALASIMVLAACIGCLHCKTVSGKTLMTWLKEYFLLVLAALAAFLWP
ncbi:hypothetical protein H710_01110 [Bartonella bacilliformis Ver097]|uniref:Uncharacterized protein n=1 Tax=Bartonella bacilliformis Ver097 TaxID=1293911 RepID=A0A072R080_BARBA|nr:hypothetical protein H710_01110 [Bartonella bacilliformis Ver097]